MNNYNVFIKRDENGVVLNTILIKTNFNFYVFFLSFMLIFIIYNSFVFNVVFSFLFGLKYGFFISKILVVVFGYQYLGWSNEKNKQKAKERFLESLKKKE
jgi:hypothetical protein